MRVFVTSGVLKWNKEHANDLQVTGKDGSVTTIRSATAAAGDAAASLTRTPPGHPEGYLEAFGNIYSAFARAVRGEEQPVDCAYPTVEDGVRGIRFIGSALLSNKENRWVDIPG